MRKMIGWAMLIGGIVFFVFLNQANKKYLEINATGSSMLPINVEWEVEAENEYLVKCWFLDEETGFEWASMEAELRIEQNGKQVHAENYVASSSEDSGGVKRAQNTDEIRYIPAVSGVMSVNGRLIKGDKWEVEIYKNMSDKENLAPPFALLVAVIGLVLVLKSKKQIV